MAVSPEQMGFYGAAQVVRLRRRVQRLSDGWTSDETVWAITSLEPLADARANGEFLLQIARGHWMIENGNHYVRDRTYDEDRCAVREPNSARILATLRSLAGFLAREGAHRPGTAHQQTTPALQRFCNAYRNRALRWLISPRGWR